MTHSLPTKIVLKLQPKEYVTQGLSHCGVYSLKAVLSAYGLDNKAHPQDYHSNWFGRFTGLTVGPGYLVNILKSHGVDAAKGSAEKLPDKEKLDLLRNLLAKGSPVMIRIGNGYYQSDDTYNPLLGKIMGHWITIWGYDHSRHVFYVYDSGLLKKHWDRTVPIGNTTRTYKEILRDWHFGRAQPWHWYLSPKNNLYIKTVLKGRV